VLSLCPCLDTPISVCVLCARFLMFQSPPGIVGVACLWHRYFGGRGLKSLGTPDIEDNSENKIQFTASVQAPLWSITYILHRFSHLRAQLSETQTITSAAAGYAEKQFALKVKKLGQEVA